MVWPKAKNKSSLWNEEHVLPGERRTAQRWTGFSCSFEPPTQVPPKPRSWTGALQDDRMVCSDQITLICLLFLFGFCLLVRKRQHHFPGCSSGHHFLAPASLTSWRSQHHFCSFSYQPPTVTPDHGSPNSNAILFSFFLQVFPRLVSWNYSQLRSVSKCIIDYVYSYYTNIQLTIQPIRN